MKSLWVVGLIHPYGRNVIITEHETHKKAFKEYMKHETLMRCVYEVKEGTFEAINSGFSRYDYAEKHKVEQEISQRYNAKKVIG